MKRDLNKLSYLGQILSLARPFGLRRMAVVFAFALVQGVMQVIGVTSIFPFLALAADPNEFKNSDIGTKILAHLPPMEDSKLLLISGIVAIGLLILSNAVNIGAEISRNRYCQQFGHWMRSKLLQRIIQQPYEYFFTHNTSRLIKIITGDVYTFINGVFLPLLDTIARVIIVALLSLTLFLIDPAITSGAIIIFGTFYGIVFVSLKGIRMRTSDGALDGSRGMIKETQQLLSGIKPIKAQDSQDYFFRRFEFHSKRMADLMSWVNVFGNGPRYLIEPLAFGGLVVVVLLFSAQGSDLKSSLPILGLMALAAYRLMPAVQLIYGQLNQLSTMRYAFEEVREEMLRDDPIPALAATKSEPASIEWNDSLRMENVCYSYTDAATPVFKNVNLELKKGQSVGVVGASGSGKSTLADLVMGILSPQSGVIKVDDVTLSKNNITAWRKHVAYVPQETFIIDDTVISNIAFGVAEEDLDDALLKEACKKAQILDFIVNELPDGFHSILGERGIRLSGGQRQRIGLARALYRKPALLVLDEATSALDESTESDVVSAIESLKGDITLLFVTHRLTTVRNYDLWWSVEDGQLNILTSLTGDLIEQHVAKRRQP